MRPLFVTGASAKVKINGVTLAYCTELSYRVEINHSIPRVLGMYEGVSLEPLSYSVTGTFSVVRYVDGAKSLLTAQGAVFSGAKISEGGNGIGNIAPERDDPANSKNKRIYDQLVPASLEAGTTFDIEVYQKFPESLDAQNQQRVKGERLLAVARIRKARIARAEAALSKNSSLIERYSFIALYLDEDSFIANPSGYFGDGNRYEQGKLGK